MNAKLFCFLPVFFLPATTELPMTTRTTRNKSAPKFKFRRWGGRWCIMGPKPLCCFSSGQTSAARGLAQRRRTRVKAAQAIYIRVVSRPWWPPLALAFEAICTSWCNMDLNFITFTQIGFMARASGESRKRSPNRCKSAASHNLSFTIMLFSSCSLMAEAASWPPLLSSEASIMASGLRLLRRRKTQDERLGVGSRLASRDLSGSQTAKLFSLPSAIEVGIQTRSWSLVLLSRPILWSSFSVL